MKGTARVIIKIKGGPGSGNWAHRGIPGKVGGSSPRGVGMSSLATKRPKLQGNGRFGNDGTATNRQVALANKLIHKLPEWDEFRGLDKVDAKWHADKQLANAERVLSSIGTHMEYGSDEFKTESGKKVYDSALQWVQTVDTTAMTENGIDKFIGSMKKGGAFYAYSRAFSSGIKLRNKVDFLNSILGDKVQAVGGAVAPLSKSDFLNSDEYKRFVDSSNRRALRSIDWPD